MEDITKDKMNKLKTANSTLSALENLNVMIDYGSFELIHCSH